MVWPRYLLFFTSGICTLFFTLSMGDITNGIKRHRDSHYNISAEKQEGAHMTNQKTSIKLTILYDNYVSTPGTISEWGFSCLIEGTEKTILFDTGTKSDILMNNIKILKVDLKKVDQIVLSHQHQDHTGGLWEVLKQNNKVSVYVPKSFTETFCNRVEKNGAKLIKVNQPLEICEDCYLTGEMGTEIKEQSLILDTKRGLVIITGCSHPGIVNILKQAKEIIDKDIYLVTGGFHLLNHSPNEIDEIIRQFKELKIQKVGPTHCTGDNAINLFRKAYEKNFIKIGTGKVITL